MFAEHQESKGVSCSQLSGGFHFSGNLPAAQQRLLWKTNFFLQLRDRTPGWAERKELSIDVGLQGLQSERSARVPLVQRSMLNQHHAGLVSCRSTRYHCLFHRYIDRSLLIPQEFLSGNEGLVLNNNWDPALLPGSSVYQRYFIWFLVKANLYLLNSSQKGGLYTMKCVQWFAANGCIYRYQMILESEMKCFDNIGESDIEHS